MKVTVETKDDVTVGFGDVIQLEALSGKQHYLITYNPPLGSQKLLLVSLESGLIWSDGIELTKKEILSLTNKEYSFFELVNSIGDLYAWNPKVVTAEVTIKDVK